MRIVTYITDDDYARIADSVRDYETDKHTQGDGPDAEPVEVISPAAWFADCADYVIPDTEEGCEELRLDLIGVLEAEEGSALLALAALGMCIRDAFLNNGMTVNHLRKPK